MTHELFERNFSHLSDSEDAKKVFGPNMHAGIATVGEIRKAVQGHPPEASIRMENNGFGFYVSDFLDTFSA